VLVLIVAAVIAFGVALRIRKRSVRILIGILLLALAAGCGLFSVTAVLLVGLMGAIALVLGARTPTVLR
jgi:hypothetical protein